MRIISQDSRIDLPYERTTLCLDGVLVTARCDEKQYLMGKYSTEEKAVKAMEMCRNEYCKFYSVSGGTNAFTGVTIQPGVFMYPKVFQFPADDEIQRARKK